MLRYPIPPILERIGSSHCVIEASAGTGKTFTLEHLVVQLIIEGIPLEELLVVTFTKKATLELIGRVRAMLARVAAFEGPSCSEEKPHWKLSAAALEQIRTALTRFDQAHISTFHQICQQILKEASFESGRLLKQEIVSRDELFERAFTTLLRTRFATGQGDGLRVALARSEGLEGLKKLIKQAAGEGGDLDLPPLTDLRSILEAFPVDLAQRLLQQDPELCAPLTGARGGVPIAITRLLETICRKRESALAGDPTDFWLRDPLSASDFGKWLEKGEESPLQGDSARLFGAVAELFNLEALLVASFLSPLQEEIQRLKAEEGLYDFDDMIQLVARALEDEIHGTPLVQRLRERFKVAIIDEFQDTDAAQWGIFRRLFLDSEAGHRLIVVGDPKQAIYGFRGGDLPTYTEATRAIEGRTGRPPLQLRENWRSTGSLITAYNTLLDPSRAFFQGDNAAYYKEPVTCGRLDLALEDAAGNPLPAVRVVEIEAGKADQVRVEAARALARTLRNTLEGARFRNSRDAVGALRPEDVYVLVHTRSEGQLMAKILREEGLPAAIYREEGLFDGPEAKACRDILLAIASPRDESRVAKALLGPFFGLSFREAEAARELPEEHPIRSRLLAWRALAQQGRYGELFNRLAGESGLTRRLLFLEEGQRSLTNLLHILELLLHQALRGHLSAEDLAHQVQRWIDDQERPAVEEGETQRLERQQGAVQILTMHKSKGLQAPVVVLYGGTGETGKTSALHRYHDPQQRRCWVGSTKLAPKAVQAAIDEELKREDERLAYVALTRAEAQLLLPHYIPGGKPNDKGNFNREGHPKAGPYRPINHSLRTLLAPGEEAEPPQGFERFSPEPPIEPPDQSWSPSIPEFPLTLPDFSALAAQARPHGVFSYTGMQRALDQHRGPTPLRPDQESQQWGQSGGKKLGIQVHALLQEVDLESFAELDFQAWRALPSTQALAQKHLASKWQLEVLEWAYAALARPMALPGGGESVLSRAEDQLRELDFLTPYPQERDFLQGSIDLIFRSGGRTYVLDWKTNLLPDYGPEALEASVQDHYQLQLRIYTLTACRFLGIRDRTQYERDFGGVVYVYLRGLPQGGGVWSHRPAWEELADWERELGDCHRKLVGGGTHA
nr:UvrD-helicase domain-containing protein [uncultured Holophaga sp.]